jgi:hypothetical protein
MQQPKNYVVRIYRQGARTLTGVVEDVRSGEQRPFSNMQELWMLLRRPCSASSVPLSRSPARLSASSKPA